MNFNKNYKMINYFTIASLIFEKEGPRYIFSKKVEEAIKNNDPELAIKFLFAIAYEAQDAYPETIEDNMNCCEKIREYLNYILPSLKDNHDIFMYNMAMSFTYQYKVFSNKQKLGKYIKDNFDDKNEAKNIISDSLNSLRLAMIYMEKAISIPIDNLILSSMVVSERTQLVNYLRGYLQNDVVPDIDSIIVFYDQLENLDWWNTISDLTFNFIYKPA